MISSHCAFRLRLLLLSVVFPVLTGCLIYRADVLEPTETYARLNKSALSDRHALREETLQQLRVRNLEGAYNADPAGTLVRMEELLAGNGDQELTIAAAETAFAYARNLENEQPKVSAAYYVLALDWARKYLQRSLGTPEGSIVARTPRFAANIYNESLTRLVVLWQQLGFSWKEPFELRTRINTYRLRVESTGENLFDPSYFDQLTPTYAMRIEGLRNLFRTYGIGASFVGIRANKPGSPDYAPMMTEPAIVQPVTAVLVKGDEGEGPHSSNILLRFYDPSRTEVIKLGELSLPLETDLSTSLGVLLEQQRISSLWFLE